MKLMYNSEFRSISPNECILKDTLVWIEDTGFQNEARVVGPFILLGNWAPTSFGAPNDQSGLSGVSAAAKGMANGVKLLDSETGHVQLVTFGSFLFSTYYVINEETQCIDAKISQQ